MAFSKRIVIERYSEDLAEASDCAGLIEGETEDGESWILFLDGKGKPQIYWGHRDPDGAVRGQPRQLWTPHPDTKDWGSSDHPMTYEEAHAHHNTGLQSCGSESDDLG